MSPSPPRTSTPSTPSSPTRSGSLPLTTCRWCVVFLASLFNDSSARCVELCMCVPVVRDGCGRGSREPSVQGCWRDWGDGGAGDRWRADLPGVQGELRLHEVYRGRLSNNPKLLWSSRAFTVESILMLLFEHKIKNRRITCPSW
jgi:hypothetical protein